MAERLEEEPTKSLRDYVVPYVDGVYSSIVRPAIQANTFEIKSAIIQMIQTSVQLGGMPDDDPNAHIANFSKICDTFKHNGVSPDAIRLKILSFFTQRQGKELAHVTSI